MWLDSIANSVARIFSYIAILFLILGKLNVNWRVTAMCEQPSSVECNPTEPCITEPWLQPCGTTLTSVATNLQQQRHSVHSFLKKVRMKMRVARYSYQCFKNERKGIYKNAVALHGRNKFNWLPSKELMWYCHDVSCLLDKEKKAQRILPRLYDDLQRLAITFHELGKFHLNSSVDATGIIHIRNWMINVTFNQILQMLCEVENGMYNLQIDIPPPKNRAIITSKFWSKEGDVTQMLIQDSGVLKIYRTFLLNWKLIMLHVLNSPKFNSCKTKFHSEAQIKKLKRRCFLERKRKNSLKRRIQMIRKQSEL
ncbi:uncharacterized protein LOC114928873 isoform X2 [Nylanderia fulva]|uniref:uncharacterized protein LOC114928873 isoform X2 n=1 Tax=Nylanderia fulva TaxID=613905 RepID=UPI0010FAD166|nr:uncharacterized protein LOC114928873 isoform X2 [Nylanderia fulva]